MSAGSGNILKESDADLRITLYSQWNKLVSWNLDSYVDRISSDTVIKRQVVGVPNVGRQLNLNFDTLTQVQGVI